MNDDASAGPAVVVLEAGHYIVELAGDDGEIVEHQVEIKKRTRVKVTPAKEAI